jgi:hypothetical protein
LFQLAACTLSTRNLTKRTIIDGGLNLAQAEWKGDAENASGFQAIFNKIFRDNGFTQRVSGPTRGDALLDIYYPRPEDSFISFNILPGIIDHNRSLLELEWDKKFREPEVERIFPVDLKTDVLSLQASLREKFSLSAGNGSYLEEIRLNYKDIIF